jgi:hypothetical protein
LFLSIVEDLSIILGDVKIRGRLKGINIKGVFSITHLLFVDDVILFGVGYVREEKYIKRALNLFGIVTGMEVNL